MEQSLALCRAAYAAGTRTIVATPHVNWDFPAVSPSAIHAGVAAVNEALSAAAIDVEVRPGAEVTLSRVEELTESDLRDLQLGDGPYVLIELPDSSGAAGIENALRAFADRGFQVVLAHPERSRALARSPGLVARLVDQGVLCCVTARALTGHSGSAVRGFAWELLEAELVHVIASDAHDAARRPPDFLRELERTGLGRAQIDYFTRETPLAIIEGRPPTPPPVVTRGRRGRLWRLTHRSSAAR